jgi:5-methylcytosine-specific restriction endonuclease McrA
MIKKNITKDEIVNAIKNTSYMGEAAKYLHIDWRTFRRLAEQYDLYDPKIGQGTKYDLNDILNGRHPQYPTSKLSKRLIKEGLKEYRCERCKIVDYNGEHISLELNHKDGNNANHCLENLELLCPNCHSQTETYRFKNKKHIEE